MNTATATLICISPDSAYSLFPSPSSLLINNQPCSHRDFNIFFSLRLYSSLMSDFLIYESRIPASGLILLLKDSRLIEWKRRKTKNKTNRNYIFNIVNSIFTTTCLRCGEENKITSPCISHRGNCR